MIEILRTVITLWIDALIIVALSIFLALGSPIFQNVPQVDFSK